MVLQRMAMCYALLQESEGSFIKFINGIPDDDEEIVTDPIIPHLIVFDAMLGDKDEVKIKLWFTRKGHHRNASVIYITQNMFQQSKASRTISFNAHYMILFQNTRDKGKIKVLEHQIQIPHLLPAYQDAISEPHGYLVIDFYPKTPESYRVRTDIFHRSVTGEERGPVVHTGL